MQRQQNRSRSRDNYGNNNRNRPRNNDNRRRDDYDRNTNRYQGGGGGGGNRRNDQGNRMSQNRGYGNNMNPGGYSQSMGVYPGGQMQMAGFGGYGVSTAFQQNRFGMNQQQMINPWANNMMPSSSMGSTGEEAKLAMNILNAVLSSSGQSPSGRGMSPPPNKMRRMDYREGGYDDRRRRPRSPQGRSHQNRQQSSQRFGSDRRGRDGHSSHQRNDDHRFRNSFSKSPGVSRSSRQSSIESSEYVFRKRLSFEEREKEAKKFKDLPLQALKCRMCEKTTFHSVAAYLAHVDSKGHNKVARSFHEKIAATATVLKQNAQLALHKALLKAKNMDVKVIEKECRVCEAPMLYGNLKHKNMLECKILHKFHNETVCCGKDHKSKSLVEEHCLSLSHLKVKYESESPKDVSDEENKEENTEGLDENVEDEEEKKNRLQRDVARRKRKFGEDETDEEEDDDDEEEDNQDDKEDESIKNNEDDEEKKEEDTEPTKTNNENEENEEKETEEQMEVTEEASKDSEAGKEENDEAKSECMDENQDEKDIENKDDIKENGVSKKATENRENKKSDRDTRRDRNQDRRKENNKQKNKNNKDDKNQGKTLQQMNMKELVEVHKKCLVDDPECVGPFDPANPLGLNFISTNVAFHCMACIEYYPASSEHLMAHCCSSEHYNMFRSKYMKLQGVKDTPMNLKRLKNVASKESKDKVEDKPKETKYKKREKENKEKDSKERASKEREGQDSKPATENEEVTGDDALYDPYEGESGDLTTMLQDKEESTEDQEGQVPEGYEVQDEAQESEPENYEDNVLDYELEDVGEEDDKDENKCQEEENKKTREQKEEIEDDQEENEDDQEEENQENEDNPEEENEEDQEDFDEQYQDEENEEENPNEEEEEYEDNENEEYDDDENEDDEDQVESEGDEEA